MLLLLPLRLWAGVAMAQSDCHRLMGPSPAVFSDAAVLIQPAGHADHSDHRMPEGHHDNHHAVTLDLPDGLAHTGSESGHEGPGCIACALCHLSAGLPGQVATWWAHALHSAPSTVAVSLHGHAWPPLIKPPIA